MFAFGERFVSRRVVDPTLRVAELSPFGVPWRDVPPWALLALALGGAGWLAVRLEVPRALRARPAYGTLSLVVCVSLLAVPAGGGGDPGGVVTRWYVADPLGSTTLVLAADAEVSRRQTDPFGQVASESFSEPTHRLFTGQRIDPATGLADYRARWYDPAAARFLSSDPLIPAVFDPQQHNAFAYARGNPLRYTDPTGMGPEAGGCLANLLFCAIAVGITILNLSGDAEVEGEEPPPFLGPAGPPSGGIEISIEFDLPAGSLEDANAAAQQAGAEASGPEQVQSVEAPEVRRDGHDLVAFVNMYALFTGIAGILRGGGAWAARAWRVFTRPGVDDVSAVGEAASAGAQAADDAARVIGRSAGAQEAIFTGKRITNELAEQLGIPRRILGRAVERIKRASGLRGNENVAIGRATGDVYDPRTGELIGNVFDEVPFVK